MKTEADSRTDMRYLGVDLHKHYLVIGGVNARQEVVLAPRRIELDKWLVWAKAHLRQTDVLVVEVMGNTWTFYDEVVELVARVEVANAGKIALIANTRVKTDKHDVMKLAKLSAAGRRRRARPGPRPDRRDKTRAAASSAGPNGAGARCSRCDIDGSPPGRGKSYRCSRAAALRGTCGALAPRGRSIADGEGGRARR